jgi:hypothetical protein
MHCVVYDVLEYEFLFVGKRFLRLLFNYIKSFYIL